MSRNAKILVVEDDTALNEAFRIILTKKGYDVTVAYDGKEALEKVANQDYDLILLDLLMPVMDGREFLEKVTLDENKTKTIVFSNLDTQTDISEIKSLGATKYLLKAWASPRELLRIVQDTLRERTNSASRA